MKRQFIAMTLVVLTMCALVIASCNSAPYPAQPVVVAPAPQVVYQQPAPVVVQGHSNGVGNFAAGAVTGAIVGSALSRPTTVYRPMYRAPARTVIVKKYYGRRR